MSNLEIFHQIFNTMYHDHLLLGTSFNWLQHKESILNNTVYPHIYKQNGNQDTQRPGIQKLYSNRNQSSKARNYLYRKEK